MKDRRRASRESMAWTLAFGQPETARQRIGYAPTLPLNPAKEHWVGWWIKVTGLPLMYWNYMLKGYVWFPKHNTGLRRRKR
jgi:hypothetical protein